MMDNFCFHFGICKIPIYRDQLEALVTVVLQETSIAWTTQGNMGTLQIPSTECTGQV